MHLTPATLAPLNKRFEAATPGEILRFTHHVFASRAAILSSMQKSGSVLAHMSDRDALPFDVLFVDTGLMHPETLATRDRLARAHPRHRFITLHPERTVDEQTRAEGVLYLTREGQERCCDLRKSAPLRTQRGRYDALISPLRRDEGGARAAIEIFSLDPDLQAVRVHPLANFTREDIERYVASHADLVVHPLHALGFPTIGCFPCTTPVRVDEGERAGRWRHLAGVEYCRINPVDRGEAETAIDLDDRYVSLLGS